MKARGLPTPKFDGRHFLDLKPAHEVVTKQKIGAHAKHGMAASPQKGVIDLGRIANHTPYRMLCDEEYYLEAHFHPYFSLAMSISTVR